MENERGAGAMACFMVATFSALILRVALAFFLAAKMGTIGIWLSWPLGWAISSGLSLGFYLTGRWE